MAFVVIKCFFLLFNYNCFFGENSIVYKHFYHQGYIKNLAFIIYQNPQLALYFIIVCIALCLILFLTSTYYFFIGIVIWFVVLNLSNAVYSSNTGADYLLNQLLLFLSIIPSNSKIVFTEIKTVFYNFGAIAIFIQLFLVYLLSAYAKLTDADWQAGTAISYISKCNHYSLFQINNLILSKILSYLVIGYQLLFPLFIWFKTTKKYVLLAGVVMHLYIAFAMGLMSFGLIMVLCYSLFFDLKLLLPKK